jgi:serine protease Do
MKNKIFIGIAILLVGFLLGGISYYFLQEFTGRNKGYYAQPPMPRVTRQVIESSKAFSEIASSLSPAVVNISSTKLIRRDHDSFFDDPFFDFFNPFRNFRFPKKWKEQSLGSGVIVSRDGYIITNNHVVEQAEEIKVTLFDKRAFRAHVTGTDPKTDVAIVKIDAMDLPSVTWGNSDNLQVGEFVLAIGNPYGLSHTVTMGIISAVGRASVGIADYEDFIQTDAAINPGNSGGPLVNIKGELIGINTAIFSRSGGYQGIGFAVPSNMARLVMEQLVKEGKVTRGWLGVTIQELTPELSEKFGLQRSQGALVGDVAAGSPAAKAGIKRGDIILEFNGKKVKDVGGLKNMVAKAEIGSELSVTILREGRKQALKMVIKELPKEFAEKSGPEMVPEEFRFEGLAGLAVTELTGDIARQLGLRSNEKGVVIVRIEQGSPPEEAGLRRGDVIQEIDKKKIDSLDAYNKIVAKIKPNGSVLLFINRGGQRFYQTVKVS